MATFKEPCPLQASHRPPATLNEKRPGLYPRARLSGVKEKSFRISDRNPTYEAGTDRGVRPIGL